MDLHLITDFFEGIRVNSIGAAAIVAFIIDLLLLCCSAFMSSCEVAYFSLKPIDLQNIRERNHSSDISLSNLLDNSNQLLATILIGNNVINVAIVILSNYAIEQTFDFSSPIVGFLIQTILLTTILLLFGEILPKVYARKNPLQYSRFSAAAMSVIYKVLSPFSKLLVKSTGIVTRSISKKKYDISVDELSKAVALTTTEGEPEEKEMINEIIKFYNKTASEIMVPRMDIVDVDLSWPFRKMLDFVVSSGYSRLPVSEGSEDNIKGVIYIKDLIPHMEKDDDFDWHPLIRKAYFVPENKRIDDLLEEFRANKVHVSIVVDEFGGTCGLITMEDILEEIVGEITDEYDEEELPFKVLGDGSYLFEGKTSLSDVRHYLDLPENAFGELGDEVDTLSGLFLEIKQELPHVGDTAAYEPFRFQVTQMDKRRIIEIKIFPFERTWETE
ncbi:hemolysin [Porphyromonas gulae]|uniref:gliding motility-associated protein GldE n=1 Tax=Porphyromonas gulae TaxID=111105 RepID=UPI0003A5DC4F|nr:gliding motility-associated protein GldE [Porphyromonas gulae]KGN80602.1 hemolysin [Porphyromonas gulae]KGO03641.1 hemolysin [Porphyromonas gulae]